MKKLLLIALMCYVGLAEAQIPKARPKTFVNDYAGILTAADVKALNQKIYKIQKETGVQLAVVLVNEIPAAYTIKTYATQIGQKWHVGTNKRGLVYVAAIKSHLQRLAVAKNLNTVFTDEKSAEILSAIKNAYRAGDYNGGLTILVNKIHTTLVPTSAVPADNTPAAPVAEPATAKAADTDAPKKADDYGNAFIGFIFVAGVVLLVYLIYRYNKNKNRRIAEENYRMAQQYNNGSNNNGDGYGGYSGGGGRSYSSGGRPQQSGRSSSGIGGILGGAALGAAAGYGARYLQDKLNENHASPTTDNGNITVPNSFTPDITADNNEDNYGKWGAGDSSADSGFSDDTSFNDGGLSDDSGFSDDSSSSDSGDSSSGGATSSW